MAIAPSVSSPMQQQFLQTHVVDPPSKMTHHRPVKVLVVLVCFTTYQVEVPANYLRSVTSLPDFPELLQELHLVL
jgi:hypothetical protein